MVSLAISQRCLVPRNCDMGHMSWCIVGRDLRDPIHLNQHAKIEVLVLRHSRSAIARGMEVPLNTEAIHNRSVATYLSAQPGVAIVRSA